MCFCVSLCEFLPVLDLCVLGPGRQTHSASHSSPPHVQDDYLDCYGAPEVIGKIGTDIEDNKCSWLVVQALDRVTPEQRKVLEENYGQKHAPEKVWSGGGGRFCECSAGTFFGCIFGVFFLCARVNG